MSSNNAGPYCPECAGTMRTTGRIEVSGLPRYHCPHCDYDSGAGIQNAYTQAAFEAPPDDPARCKRCGAWHSRYADERRCRRCGAPRQVTDEQAPPRQPLDIQRQPDAPQAAPTPQQPSWQQPQTGFSFASGAPVARSGGAGCLGRTLGMIDVVIGVLIAVVLIVTALTSGGVRGHDLLTLVVGGIVVVLGIRLGMRAIKSETTRAKVWAVLYLPLVVLAVLFLLATQGLF